MGTCDNCELWKYDRYTEEFYGMGVGRCGADGAPQFRSHRCPFCVPREEEEE